MSLVRVKKLNGLYAFEGRQFHPLLLQDSAVFWQIENINFFSHVFNRGPGLSRSLLWKAHLVLQQLELSEQICTKRNDKLERTTVCVALRERLVVFALLVIDNKEMQIVRVQHLHLRSDIVAPPPFPPVLHKSSAKVFNSLKQFYRGLMPQKRIFILMVGHFALENKHHCFLLSIAVRRWRHHFKSIITLVLSLILLFTLH